MKKQGEKVAASVTVYKVADMTKNGRKEVCDWLRKLADDLQSEPESFAKTFIARYLYSSNRQHHPRGFRVGVDVFVLASLNFFYKEVS